MGENRPFYPNFRLKGPKTHSSQDDPYFHKETLLNDLFPFTTQNLYSPAVN